jgi:hypothetical protein
MEFQEETNILIWKYVNGISRGLMSWSWNQIPGFALHLFVNKKISSNIAVTADFR